MPETRRSVGAGYGDRKRTCLPSSVAEKGNVGLDASVDEEVGADPLVSLEVGQLLQGCGGHALPGALSDRLEVIGVGVIVGQAKLGEGRPTAVGQPQVREAGPELRGMEEGVEVLLVIAAQEASMPIADLCRCPTVPASSERDSGTAGPWG